MGGGKGSARNEGLTTREIIVLLLAAALCVALPALAQHQLGLRVSDELAPRMEAKLGLPVQLGNASVGLTGTLEIRDVRVGEFLRAERVIASIAPGTGSSYNLAPNELLVDRPRLMLEVDRDGRTNLDEMLELRRSRQREPSPEEPGSKNTRLRTLRFVGGSLTATIEDVGIVESEGINLWMRDGKLHALVGETSIALWQGDFRAEGTMPRAALDYQRGYGLRRLLADGGAFSVKGPRGRGMLKEVMLAVGIDGDDLTFSAQTGIDRATGSIRVRAEPTLEGAHIVATLHEAPLALLAPWIPQTIEPRTTLASGEVSLSGSLGKAKRFDLTLRSLALTGMEVHERALSSRKLDFDVTLDLTASLRHTDVGPLLSAKIESIQSGELVLSGSASGQWKNGTHIPQLANLALELEDVRCDAALNSLPSGLRASLAGLELRGTMRSSLSLSLARDRMQPTHLEVDSGADGCGVANEPPTANTRDLTSAYEHRTPDGRTRVLAPSNPEFVRYKDLPSYVPKTFVAAEDARFFMHDGFDVHQIERSLAIDMQNGRLLRGGSTISQQLVKNLFLNRRRSLARKLQEAVLTWRLEDNVDKKRILEIYLNIIELGDEHTYGIAEASQRWFGVSPSELSVLQTAFLAALTPEPTSMSARIREAGGLDAVSAGRVATILRVMRRAKVISSSEYRKAKSEALVLRSQVREERTATLRTR